MFLNHCGVCSFWSPVHIPVDDFLLHLLDTEVIFKVQLHGGHCKFQGSRAVSDFLTIVTLSAYPRARHGGDTP